MRIYSFEQKRIINLLKKSLKNMFNWVFHKYVICNEITNSISLICGDYSDT